jgi:hypothetical protein
MKKIIFILLLSPLIIIAQKLPRFENDTLYTSGGYKIYKGQTLSFAEGSGKNGNFRYAKLKGNDTPGTFANKSVVVEEVSDFKISGLNNAFIRIHGELIRNNGERKRIIFYLAFDKAIEGVQGMAPELIVPEEFKNKSQKSAADEIAKLYKLYQDGAISKEEFEIKKMKLLEQ